MDADAEITAGSRFGFGENWSRFLSVLDEDRIRQAELHLMQMLDVSTLAGKTFIDIGSGSGLSSLAARRLGAKVHSFDFDHKSVACTRELKRRYYNDDENWNIEQGSVLDKSFIDKFTEFDVVYSWGVLHHTGSMWESLENITKIPIDGGSLYISIYNDQGFMSRLWLMFKTIYNRLPNLLKFPFTILIMGPREMASFIFSIVRGNPMNYIRSWTLYKKQRGMSRWHDIVDWIGGLPFEVAKPEHIFDFFRKRDFELRKLSTCAGGLGCNEYVFIKTKNKSE